MSINVQWVTIHEGDGWIVAQDIVSASERATMEFSLALLMRSPKDGQVHVVAGMSTRDQLVDLLFALRQIGDPVRNYWRLLPSDGGVFQLKARGKAKVRWTFLSYDQVARAAQTIDHALTIIPNKD